MVLPRNQGSGALALVVVIGVLVSGCGSSGTLSAKALSQESTSLQSLAAEGALLGRDAVAGKTRGSSPACTRGTSPRRRRSYGSLGFLERYGVGTGGSGGANAAKVHGHSAILWERVARVGAEIVIRD